MGAWGWVYFGVLFLLSACGGSEVQNQSSQLPTFDVPKLDSEREEFLHKFPLVNDVEDEAPPRDPVTGRAPFGALIHMAAMGQGSFCSMAHVSPGRVATNAHCIHANTKPEEYFVVFYNKRD